MLRRFKIKAGNASFEVTRTQFPVRLAYAMTYNKSQSQTLQKVLVDSIDPPFSHGHLYVAFSRVRDPRNIRLLCSTEDLFSKEPIDTTVHHNDSDNDDKTKPDISIITEVTSVRNVIFDSVLPINY